MTNSYSPQPPKTSANWLRSFLHRSKRAKPDKKGTRPLFKTLNSALAARCFSTESAESGPSLQVKSLTSIQEEADLQHKTHVRSAANVSFEPIVRHLHHAQALIALLHQNPQLESELRTNYERCQYNRLD
jgi:hypothetical protein